MLSHIDVGVEFVRENMGPYALLWSRCAVGQVVCAVLTEDHDEDVHGAYSVLIGGRLSQVKSFEPGAVPIIYQPGVPWRGRGRRLKGEYCQTRMDPDMQVIQIWLRAPRTNTGVPSIYPEGTAYSFAAADSVTIKQTDLAVIVTDGLMSDGKPLYPGEVIYAETRPVEIVGIGSFEHLWVPPGYDFSALGVAAG
jgi:hypothetical protein